jgi:hypothetical protein
MEPERHPDVPPDGTLIPNVSADCADFVAQALAADGINVESYSAYEAAAGGPQAP